MSICKSSFRVGQSSQQLLQMHPVHDDLEGFHFSVSKLDFVLVPIPTVHESGSQIS